MRAAYCLTWKSNRKGGGERGGRLIGCGWIAEGRDERPAATSVALSAVLGRHSRPYEDLWRSRTSRTRSGSRGCRSTPERSQRAVNGRFQAQAGCVRPGCWHRARPGGCAAAVDLGVRRSLRACKWGACQPCHGVLRPRQRSGAAGVCTAATGRASHGRAWYLTCSIRPDPAVSRPSTDLCTTSARWQPPKVRRCEDARTRRRFAVLSGLPVSPPPVKYTVARTGSARM